MKFLKKYFRSEKEFNEKLIMKILMLIGLLATEYYALPLIQKYVNDLPDNTYLKEGDMLFNKGQSVS